MFVLFFKNICTIHHQSDFLEIVSMFVVGIAYLTYFSKVEAMPITNRNF